VRWRARTDANQKPIVEYLRKKGYAVKCCHQIGAGFPDLLVSETWEPYEMWLVEVKDGRNAKFTESQMEFYKAWTGKPVLVFREISDVVEWCDRRINGS